MVRSYPRWFADLTLIIDHRGDALGAGICGLDFAKISPSKQDS